MLNQILYTACITPFDEHGHVDYRSMEKILKAQEEAGNGILLFGSTGEGLSLTDQEKQEILSFACQLHLKTQLVVGAPVYSLEKVMAWIDFCNSLPLSGYLMSPPVYTKPGIAGQTKWFHTLLDHSAHPIMLYNIPSRTGVPLYPDVIQSLAQHPRLAAIKDCGGTLDHFMAYKAASPSTTLYCGDDYLMPALAAQGAAGLVSVAANAWPSAVRCYAQCALSQTPIKTPLWWQACHALFSASNPIPIKALLKDIQMIEHDTVRAPLSMDDLPSREPLISYHHAINHWHEMHTKHEAFLASIN